jgi:hypothetical protein
MDARIAAAAALFALPLAAHAQTYTVTALGAGSAAGINDSGQVAGTLAVGSSTSYAAVWTDGTASVVGPTGAGIDYSGARAINDAGLAVGYVESDANGPNAAVFKGATTILLPIEPPFYPGIGANGINNSGVVIGTIFEGDQIAGGVWSAGCTTGSSSCTVTSLRGIGDNSHDNFYFSNASGVNNAGVVVGISYWTSRNGNPGSGATVWHNGNPEKLDNLPGLFNSSAIAINDAGTIVGDSFLKNFTSIATVWNGTTPTALAMLPGTSQDSVSGINDAGLIVGQDGNFATLWEHGKAINLNAELASTLPAGVTLEYAVGINSEGQIATEGSNGQIYVLTPSTAPEIDAGSAAGGLALLLGSLAILRGRRITTLGNGGQRIEGKNRAALHPSSLNLRPTWPC